jgi:hypothetical protein
MTVFPGQKVDPCATTFSMCIAAPRDVSGRLVLDRCESELSSDSPVSPRSAGVHRISSGGPCFVGASGDSRPEKMNLVGEQAEMSICDEEVEERLSLRVRLAGIDPRQSAIGSHSHTGGSKMAAREPACLISRLRHGEGGERNLVGEQLGDISMGEQVPARVQGSSS